MAVGYGLWESTPDGRWYPSAAATVAQANSYVTCFRLCGWLVAKAMAEDVPLEHHLAMPLLKLLRGGTGMEIDDLLAVDEGLGKSLKSILEMPEEEVVNMEIPFVREYDALGHQTVELKPGGSGILLNGANRDEFVELMVKSRLAQGIEAQLEAFCRGFWSIISASELESFSVEEMDAMISGDELVDLGQWRKYCEYHDGYHEDHVVINRFFRVLSAWEPPLLRRLLVFMTGTSRLPVGGCAGLAARGTPLVIGSADASLPRAHACFNRLDLPPYESDELMDARLRIALEHGMPFGML